MSSVNQPNPDKEETMNSKQHRSTRAWRAALWTAIGLGLAAGSHTDLRAAPVEKTARQIKVMEGILDQVLLDSPNFLVFGRDNAHGLYLDEYGAIFTFDASLTNGSGKALKNLDLPFRFDVRKGKDGTIISIPKLKEDKNKDDENGNSDEEDSQGTKGSKKIRSRAGGDEDEDDPAVLYRKGKDELIQVLLDYGDTITSLRDDQTVVIAAFLRDNSYFLDNQISRLLLKAKIRDLREHASGRLTDDQMRSRIVQEEY
jgi:hypothetical protein